ncbi:unnamed protein product [Schistocephalus solidus]|uniref:Transposase n=1 Tax=Schistocephalus solidus TaxID=70667 RepID=A0A183SU49_SCHSO|nr:unnamed protein product [Schistocephalus solidus]
MWRQGQVPQDFKDATIIHLYKRKGNRQVCDNHRGISLLNIAGKILARTLVNRLNGHLDQSLLSESQNGHFWVICHHQPAIPNPRRCGAQGSNSRPVVQKSNALPTAPRARCLGGFDQEY